MSLQDKINSKLSAWAKTPNGKAKIQKVRRAALKKGRIMGSGGSGTSGSGGNGYGVGTGTATADTVSFYRDKFLDILRDKIHDAGQNFADGDKVLVDGVFNEATGYYEYHFNFDPESIKRESLDSKRYPDGAYDIVALINHGYNADGQVYGYWKPAGKEIPSLQTREGAFFIQAAAEEFERLYGDVAKVSYNEKYDKRD